MVTLGDHTTAVTEDSGARLEGTATLPDSIPLPELWEAAVLWVQLQAWVLVPPPPTSLLSNQSETRLLCWSETCLQVQPPELVSRTQCLGVFGLLALAEPDPPALEKCDCCVCAQQQRALITGQGDWTSRLRKESCSSPFCQGEWAAGEKLVGTHLLAKSHRHLHSCLPHPHQGNLRHLFRYS